MTPTLNTPTWDAPGPDNLPWTLGGTALTIVLIVAAVTFVWENRTVKRAIDKQMSTLAVTAVVAGMALLVAAGVVAVVESITHDGDHRDEIANWLSEEYGAHVDPNQIQAGRDNSNLIQLTATIRGTTRVIKLMPTPDGHTAAFTTDDKPLAPRH